MPKAASDRNLTGTERVLVIDGGPLDPASSAGERASLDLLDGLVSLGAHVWFLPMGSKGGQDARLLHALGQRGLEKVYDPGEVRPAEWLATHAADVVIAHRPGPAAMASVALMEHPEVARIYWGHDVHARRLAAQATTRGDVEAPAARAATLAERRCWDLYDLTVYPTEREAAMVAGAEGAERALACPYFLLAGPDLPCAVPPRAGRDGLLMVGGAAHTPNLDAVEWTLAEVLPAVRAEYPDVSLTVVGEWPSEHVDRLTAPGVRFVGQVSDDELLRLHHTAICLIAPLRFGSGARRKIVAAMGLGLPVVTTPEGQEGLLVRDGRGISDGLMVANDAPALAGAVAALAYDPNLWQRCADNARRSVSAVYNQPDYQEGIVAALHTARANRDARL